MKKLYKFKNENMTFISNAPLMIINDYNSNYLWLEFVYTIENRMDGKQYNIQNQELELNCRTMDVQNTIQKNA